MDEIQKTAIFIITAGAVITAMAAILKYSIRAWDWTLDKHETGLSVRELAEIKDSLKKIVKEYEPNGGESMKDMICRIDETTREQRDKIKHIYEKLDEKVNIEDLIDGHRTEPNSK